MHLANFAFTNVKGLVIFLPSEREHEAYIPGDTAAKKMNVTVESLITETAGLKEKIKDLIYETPVYKVGDRRAEVFGKVKDLDLLQI